MDAEQDRLARLLLAHRGMLLAYVLAIVRDAHLAEDVFQDASLVILKKGSGLKKESDFPVWARKVVRLEALNALRKRNKAPELLDPATLDLLEPHWGKEEGPQESADALRGCLEKLGPKARRLIEWRYVAGIRGNALAARLNQPANTIYVALSRIYRLLSTCIQERLANEA
jgi:RNA polymerase sigma-70 factor (ECF subfamily)